MMAEPKIDKLLKKVDNRYELICAISKRARQIANGDEPRIQTDEKSPITIAAKEFDEGKYTVNM